MNPIEKEGKKKERKREKGRGGEVISAYCLLTTTIVVIFLIVFAWGLKGGGKGLLFVWNWRRSNLQGYWFFIFSDSFPFFSRFLFLFLPFSLSLFFPRLPLFCTDFHNSLPGHWYSAGNSRRTISKRIRRGVVTEGVEVKTTKPSRKPTGKPDRANQLSNEVMLFAGR